jgi:hypothetical protein
MPAAASQDGSQTRPVWMPDNVRPEDLSPELKAVLAEIIQPLYDEVVLRAPSALERATGLALVHMKWVELLEQRELAHRLTPMMFGEEATTALRAVERHLRVVSAQDKLTKTLMQVRQHEDKRAMRDELSEPDGLD